MNYINDGGAAFPMPAGADFAHGPQSGMTLRDWFAGLAMQGIYADESLTTYVKVAEAAYEMADQMLAASGRNGV